MKSLQLIVFDLDLTLWSCGGLWVDCTRPPYCRDANGRVWDSADREMKLYPDLPEILDYIDQDLGCDMALASRTEQPAWAREVLDLLGYRQRFVYEEIFPSGKTAHFANLKRDSGCDYQSMLFFDDEHRNIVEVGRLGVPCVEVENGVDWDCFRRGLDWFNL